MNVIEIDSAIVVSDPVCEAVQHKTTGSDPVLMCRMTYDWQAREQRYNSYYMPGVKVSVSWNGVPGTTVTRTADRNSYRGTVETKMTMKNFKTSIIPSRTCTVQFQFSAGPHPFDKYAVNTVSYACVSKPTKILSTYRM